jgi:putative sterol carrier protein
MPSKDEMLQQIIAALKAKIGISNDVNARWAYDLGADGYICVDCISVPHRILREDCEADARITMSLEDLWRVITGEMDSQTAFTQGRVRLTGDMALILKIDTLLGTYRAAQGA